MAPLVNNSQVLIRVFDLEGYGGCGVHHRPVRRPRDVECGEMDRFHVDNREARLEQEVEGEAGGGGGED